MAHDVFISHSAQNREVADAICAALEKAAIRCWVAPRDVRPGHSFPGEITRAIQQSKVMLLVFSSHSNKSEQVLREVQLATDSRLPLVRFRIEDVSMNDDLKYFLSTPHWLDALTPPLSNHIARLEVAITELLGRSVEVTGKNVVDSPVQPKVSSLPPPAVPPAVPPTLPVTPPPIPTESIAKKESAPVAPFPVKPDRPVPTRKSATPWILLAIAAVVVVAGVVGGVFLLMLRQSKPSQEQTSTASAQTAEKPKASPGPTSSPARVARVASKPASQPARSPKAKKPTANPEDSEETKNESAFERAGSLKRPEETLGKQKSKPNAFDRAGSDIGSDEPEAEPSPDDN